ncbi:MAG: heme exporter protein CcmB [Acidimicrobiales bacterium]|jgi:heme exporter protein B|nr:heme exporter protein CcmB [Acidimicrobiales bacterium]MDP6298901.1 heme exporter protein CcmB [Acidimicrobiales bacterium]HJM27766.1 heme exporter protein CcmB [Acidimicrobiales bacterium]HJM96716.1 heme exporter protein CcmB [Acidimicrobiales bacterium]
MLRDAWLIAQKDLRIEIRSRIITNQIAPYTLLILVLFGFALDADIETLRDTGPGLFWVSILLVAILAIQRAVDIENSDSAQDRLLLSPVSSFSIYIGKTLGLFLQLLLLEVLMMIAMIALFDSSVDDFLLVSATGVIATIAIASTGTLYGVLATGLGVRETLLPILLLPVLAPVVIGATRAFGDAFGRVNADGWAWVGLLSVVAVLYTLLGMLAYGQLLEEA